ncbi:hypothetical protein RHSP_52622 [Rhizobium freirei PRF 81]|uniref:Uncharacterized protein n=1 Tax=Rhizobium freirei PRF 81 TaxID=363754 RepID=N6UXC3_9HYPH|nr:hypothetical protein [Rhizobium freirei]ENN85406.1 hypothetical protein RHSP_52622 [Rhizobium freirei PRF 81]
MKIRSVIGAAGLGLALAVAPMGGTALGFIGAAFAKGGNGGGNGNGGGHGEGKSDHDKSGRDRDRDDVSRTSTTTTTTTTQDDPSSLKPHHFDRDSDRHSKAHHASSKTHTAKLEGSLHSLGRNYHAYLNSKDPKMAALSAYVKSYAEFEMKYGTTAVPTDPALSDNALRSALQQLSNKPVTNQELAEAKSILGVGTNTGKIEEVREALERKAEKLESQSGTEETETDPDTVN